MGTPFLIVPIHGTFAHDAAWVATGSTFWTSTKHHFPTCQIEPFGWSGKNSHAERRRAGLALRRRLASLRLTYPDHAIALVAHSHGGNVVRYALESPRTREFVSRVVFLGTPFFEVLRRDPENGLSLISAVLMVFVFGFLVLLSIPFGLTDVDRTRIAVMPGESELPAAALFFAAMLAALVFISWLADRILKALAKRSRQSLHRNKFGPLTTLSLILTTERDEAYWWLVVLDTMVEVVATVARVAPSLFFGIFFLGVVGTTVLDMSFQSTNESDTLAGRYVDALVIAAVASGRFVIALLIGSFICLPVFSMVLRGHALGYGWEGLLGNSAARIKPTRIPVGDKITQAVIPTSWRRSALTWLGRRELAHSLYYENPRYLARYLEWLSNDQPRTVSYGGSTMPNNQNRARCLWFIVGAVATAGLTVAQVEFPYLLDYLSISLAPPSRS